MSLQAGGSTSVDANFLVAHAIDVIKADYGVTVTVDGKAKDLLKFGRNKLVGTSAATIMTLPVGVLNETYVSDNLITTISSSNNSDTQACVVEGHTINSDGNFTFLVQNVTLTGQTQATLTTPLARSTRWYNNDTTDVAGVIYIYEDDTSTAGVPDTAAGVHLMTNTGKNQSEKASTTISNNDYWIITSIDGQLYEKGVAYCEIVLEIRLKGKVFREVDTIAVDGSGHTSHQFIPYLIVPANSDVRLRAIADGASTDIGGSIHGFLAKVVGT